MRFYGTAESLASWKQIIRAELNKECGATERTEDRWSFEVDLNREDREFLQENYWHATEEGQEWRWNCRITFAE